MKRIALIVALLLLCSPWRASAGMESSNSAYPLKNQTLAPSSDLTGWLKDLNTGTLSSGIGKAGVMDDGALRVRDGNDVQRDYRADNPFDARSYLACNGTTDDRAALKTLIETTAAGRRILIPGNCTILLSSPGNGNTVATFPSNTVLEMQPGAYIDLARKACAAGSTPGAACNADADCGGTTTCTCSVGSGACRFAESGTTVTLFNAAASSKAPGVIGGEIRVHGSASYGTAAYGTCSGNSKPCAPVCSSGSILAGFACDSDADCVTGTCDGATVTCATATECTQALVPPSGSGTLNLIDFSNATGAVIRDLTIADVKSAATVIKTGAEANVSGVVVKQTTSPPKAFASATVNNWPRGLSYTAVETGADSVVAFNQLQLGGSGKAGVKTGLGARVSGNAVTVDGLSYAYELSGNNTADGNVHRLGSVWGDNGLQVPAGGYKLTGDGSSVSGCTGSRGPSLGLATLVTYGPHVKAASNQQDITGCNFTGGGFCGFGTGLNVSYHSLRCYNPEISGFALATGDALNDNYVAWLKTVGAVPVWVGQTNTIVNEMCTAAATPFLCCSGANTGTCDADVGPNRNTVTNHARIANNILHLDVDNNSMLKFADTGSSTTVNIGITGNLFFSAKANTAAIDLWLDNDNFGISTTEPTGPSGAQLVNTNLFASNVFGLSGSGARAAVFSTDGSVTPDITGQRFLANSFVFTSHWLNWKWAFGWKDDVPLLSYVGGVQDINGTTGGELPTSGTNYFSPAVVDTTTNATATSFDAPLPAGNFVRMICTQDGSTDNGANVQTNAFTLATSAPADTAATCSISDAATTCCAGPGASSPCSAVADVAITSGTGYVWKHVATGSAAPTARSAICTLLMEPTDLSDD